MGEYPNFDACIQLRTLGFPQKRKYQSMYYVTPNKLICIDDLSCLKHDGITDTEDVFDKLVFRPKIEDLLEEMPFLHEVIKMSDGTYFAYSTAEEDPAYLEETGRVDKFIRARGADMRESLVNLYIAVKSSIRRQDGDPRTLSPQELMNSANVRISKSEDNTHLQS